MLKFSELEPMIEYYRVSPRGIKIAPKVRINSFGLYEYLGVSGVELKPYWITSTASYNELLEMFFEPCKWMPKLHERVYLPNPYSGCEGLLCDTFYWIDSDDGNQMKKNVGVYRTAAEAHAKSLEMGWTL